MEWKYRPSRQDRLNHVAGMLSLVYVIDLQAQQSIQQMCHGVGPDDLEERLIICPECGQMFDCRDRDQVAHHSTDEHGPKLFRRILRGQGAVPYS